MKQKIQIALILGMLVAGIRLAIIFYERHEEAVQQTKRQEAPALNPTTTSRQRSYIPMI
jgi:hypothetical protein